MGDLFSGDGLAGAVGVLFIALGGWQTYLAFASMSWSTVKGVIIERDIRTAPKDLFSVSVDVSYSFEVGGYNYVSSNYGPGGGALQKFWLPGFRRDFFVGSEFEKGSEVEVYFDARNPRRCALVVGEFVWPLIAVIIGAGILAFAFGPIQL